MATTEEPQDQVLDPSTARSTSPVTWWASNSEFQMRPSSTVWPLVCGEVAFSAVARALRGATKSINMCFWGLDPAMLLERGVATQWDKDAILGEILLKKAIDENVQVRIVVWDHYLVGIGSGGSGSNDPTDADTGGNSVNLARFRELTQRTSNIELRMTNSLGARTNIGGPSFHQKSIIVDIEDPSASTAFVMGHNMLVNYWSTKDLRRVSPRRQFYLRMTTEAGGDERLNRRIQSLQNTYNFWANDYAGPSPERAANTAQDLGRQLAEARAELQRLGGTRYNYSTTPSTSIKPYLDISTQIWGTAVADVYTNFARVWDANGSAPTPDPTSLDLTQFRPRGRRSPAQVAATFPRAGARDIEKLYFQAMKNANRYILMVNQYFRNWPVTDDVIAWYAQHRPDKKVPIMVVTNDWNLDDPENASIAEDIQDGHDGVTARKFNDSPNFEVSMTKMLTQEAGYHSEVYVHAKLLIVDDVFYTIGSANYNQRGLHSDPELNVGVVDETQALQLRRDVMNILVGNAMNEWGTGRDPDAAFTLWKNYVAANSQAALTSDPLPHGRVVSYAPTETEDGNIRNRLAETDTAQDTENV